MPAQVKELARNQKREVTSSRMRRKLASMGIVKIDKSVGGGGVRY